MKQSIRLTVVWSDSLTLIILQVWSEIWGFSLVDFRSDTDMSFWVHMAVLTIPKISCRTLPLWIMSWNDCNLFIQQSKVNTFIQQSTSRGQWWWMKRLGKIKRGAYMFLSFDPLVSLLNSLQVLKMQLHQSVNLERERIEREADREKVRDPACNKAVTKNKRKGESKKKENRMRLRGQIWDTVLILFLLIMYWFFSAAGLFIVTGGFKKQKTKQVILLIRLKWLYEQLFFNKT